MKKTIFLKYKGKKIGVGHMDCYIQSYQTEQHLLKDLFKMGISKSVGYFEMGSWDEKYYLIYDKSHWLKKKLSPVQDVFIPQQLLAIDILLKMPSGEYVVKFPSCSYTFERNKYYVKNGIICDRNEYDVSFSVQDINKAVMEYAAKGVL
jgi:hypothetical protein